MLEKLLKELREHHYEVLWRREVATNSIVIQMSKRAHQQWYRLVQEVGLDEPKSFEFMMIQNLKEMVEKLEQAIMKGEGKVD